MKRALWLPVILLLLSLFVIPSQASAMLIGFDPCDQTVLVGSVVTVDVVVNDVVDLYSVQFDLTWDPSILEYVDVSVGPFLGSDGASIFAYPPNWSPGFLDNFAASRMIVLYGVNGSGVLATLTFNAISEGASNLTLSGTRLYDSTYTGPQPIPHTAQNGSINVVPEPATMLLMGTGLVGLVGLRRKFKK